MVSLADIKCTVRECVYWKDDWCVADEIEVAPRQGTRDAYFEVGTISEPGVRRSTETQCVTFRVRGEQERRPQERERPLEARRNDEGRTHPAPRTR